MCESCDAWAASKLATSGPTGRSIAGRWYGAPRTSAKRSRRTVETTAFLAMVRRMVRRAGERVADADEIELAQLINLRQDLDDAIQTAVNGMRRRGMTWEYIGGSVGIPRNRAHEKWGAKGA